jgi:hypothetical protein
MSALVGAGTIVAGTIMAGGAEVGMVTAGITTAGAGAAGITTPRKTMSGTVAVGRGTIAGIMVADTTEPPPTHPGSCRSGLRVSSSDQRAIAARAQSSPGRGYGRAEPVLLPPAWIYFCSDPRATRPSVHSARTATAPICRLNMRRGKSVSALYPSAVTGLPKLSSGTASSC